MLTSACRTRSLFGFARAQRQLQGTLFIGTAPDASAALPGNGGLRVGKYRSAAIARQEAVNLTDAMTLKHASYNTGFTGAKLVFSSDVPVEEVCKRTLMAEVATALDGMAGAVYTGCDMNTTHQDMEYLDKLSPYVLAGLGSADIDTNMATAAGAFAAVIRTVEHLGLPRTFSIYIQVRMCGERRTSLRRMLEACM
jgi:glutamate dehydrogenase/leucine dehydrogenase